ncbi:MAG: hypothetical protein Q7T01_02375 [bacterium]|nr:hypothetical protein [bacterium]
MHTEAMTPYVLVAVIVIAAITSICGRAVLRFRFLGGCVLLLVLAMIGARIAAYLTGSVVASAIFVSTAVLLAGGGLGIAAAPRMEGGA